VLFRTSAEGCLILPDFSSAPLVESEAEVLDMVLLGMILDFDIHLYRYDYDSGLITETDRSL
jgi:hypothetical protein